MQALTFNNVTLNPISQNDGQIWLTSTELAKALNYTSAKSITNLYNANSEEFSDKMTLVIESMTNGINNSRRKIKTRIFSLRGCHLIAMFSRTEIAKKFRIWVLDILDKEVRTTSHQRDVLIRACEKLSVGKMSRPQAYALVANEFGYEKPIDIPVELIPEATAFAYETLLRLKSVEPVQTPLPIEQWQIGTMANTQSYRYLVSIRNDIDTISRRIKHMIDLNVQVNESFMAIG